jgi:hypothetical protein
VQTLQEVKNTIIAVNGGKATPLPSLENCLLKFQRIMKDSFGDRVDSDVEMIQRLLKQH